MQEHILSSQSFVFYSPNHDSAFLDESTIAFDEMKLRSVDKCSESHDRDGAAVANED